jgi:ADP-heptose:LPS heptosyltransferase
MLSNDCNTILITRLSHVGDCVLTLPLANAVRRAWPHARICWVVEPPADQLLAHHPAIDCLVVAERGWRSSWAKFRKLKADLKALNAAIVLDPQSLTKSALMGWLSGARRRIGFSAPVGGELSPWLHTERITVPRVHLLERTMQLLQPLGIRAKSPTFDLSPNSIAREQMHAALRDRHVLNGFYVVNPGGSWASKRWVPASYAVVARHLGQRFQIPAIVTWAGASERAWADVIVEKAGGHAILAPPTNLQELLAILQSARFFLGSDTGPMHMAAAVGTPCVALFGPTRPDDSGPVGQQHMCLQAYYQAGSRRTRRRASNDAMRAIEIQSVIDACEATLHRLLDTKRALPGKHFAA